MMSETNFEFKTCTICHTTNRVVAGKAHLAYCAVCNQRLMATHYDILGVKQYASNQEIKRQYRRLVRVWHPDMNPSKPYATELLGAIMTAYHTLSDGTKRRAYDEHLGVAHLRRSDVADSDKAGSEQTQEPSTREEVHRPKVSHEGLWTKLAFNLSLFMIAVIVFISWMVSEPSASASSDILLCATIGTGMYGLLRAWFVILSNLREES